MKNTFRVLGISFLVIKIRRQGAYQSIDAYVVDMEKIN
jgi:hypothetical protein